MCQLIYQDKVRNAPRYFHNEPDENRKTWSLEEVHIEPCDRFLRDTSYDFMMEFSLPTNCLRSCRK